MKIDFWADVLNFTKKLSLPKIINLITVRCAYRIASIMKRPVVWGMPYAWSIEPTSLCNLQCPECPTGTGEILRQKSNLESSLYESLVDQIARHACYLMLYLQGEPYLSASIFDMIQKASIKRIYTCISTNGHFMTDENAHKTIVSGLDRIIISLDGTTPEVYRMYRKRGSFQEVIEGIRRLVAAKTQLRSQTPFIILQFIVFKHNQHQLADIKSLGRQLGVNHVSIKSAQLYDYAQGHPMLTDLIKLARYHQEGNTVVMKNKLHRSCQRIWTTGVITTDGKMTSCCYDKHSAYVMGDTQTESLKKIWKSESFVRHRKNILSQREKIDICTNCDEK